MEREIRILMLEDEPADAVLIQHELNKNGISVVSRRVETSDEFLDELQNRTPDLIISDHGLPSFDGFEALALVRSKRPEIPFIFVTGQHGEEHVVKSLKSGATDYVLKDRLSDLAPAVHRALHGAEETRKRNEELAQWRLHCCLDILFATSTAYASPAVQVE